MTVYATIDDVMLFRKLTPDEQEKAQALLPAASALIRTTAKRYQRDFEQMICDDPDLEYVAKQVTIKAVLRAISEENSSMPAVTQGTQSAMGYSMSYTFSNPGRSLYLLKNELKDLGLLRQRYGALEVYGRNDSND